MTQVQTMTNPELNRALAELMGWTELRLTVAGYLYGREPVDKWAGYVPEYCSDPAASLEVQTAAIARHKGQYFHHLLTFKNTDLQASPMVAYVAIALATPRERAEAAYITLQGAKGNELGNITEMGK